jgi:hypothetical protein
MFLKEKQDGSLKGRTVAEGNKQGDYISKEDASLPTITTEAVLLLCIINAKEGRDVAVIDIQMHLSRCKWKMKGIWQSSRFVESSWIS